MKQTAVEWIEDKIQFDMTFIEILGLIRQAKEMHKQEIMEAYSDGSKGGANNGKGQHKNGWVSIQMKEKYYNETFGGKI